MEHLVIYTPWCTSHVIFLRNSEAIRERKAFAVVVHRLHGVCLSVDGCSKHKNYSMNINVSVIEDGTIILPPHKHAHGPDIKILSTDFPDTASNMKTMLTCSIATTRCDIQFYIQFFISLIPCYQVLNCFKMCISLNVITSGIEKALIQY